MEVFMKYNITFEELNEFIGYDESVGGSYLYWKKTKGTAKKGKIAGTLSIDGYWRIMFKRNTYLCHRVIWFINTKKWPVDELDHKNGINSDNKFSNLREASHKENLQNLGAYKNNTSGYAGVSLHKCSNKWQAQIKDSRKKHYLGLYDTKEEAYEAFLKAKARLHTFQPNPRIVEDTGHSTL